MRIKARRVMDSPVARELTKLDRRRFKHRRVVSQRRLWMCIKFREISLALPAPDSQHKVLFINML